MVDSAGVSPLRVDACWDIETEAWDTFVVGGIWRRDRGYELFRDEDSMADALLSLPKGWTAWAHAGGRFDVLWLLDWCYRNDCLPAAAVRMSGSTISALQIFGGPVLRDSYRLVPMSLEKLSRMFGGTRKQNLEALCICGKDHCKGYCAIRLDMPPATRARVEEYMCADVEALRDGLQGLVEFTEGHQLCVRGTVASSSWASAKLHAPLPNTDWDLRSFRFARAGYYGGLTAVGQTKARKVWHYDRISSYPAALRQPIPCGISRLVLDGKRAQGCFDRQRPGLYNVTIEVPESMAPPLPYRVAERIAYPWGVLKGNQDGVRRIWPRPEIEHAIERGAKLRDVHGALVWQHEEPLLRPYVEHVWKLRAAAKARAQAKGEDPDKDCLAAWLKWLANSLTGAFAQDPEQDLFAIGDKADDPLWKNVGLREWLWRRKVYKVADRAHVQWAGYLTSYARIELGEEIEHAGSDWVYSDTDSVKATRELTRNVGNDLGDWKLEDESPDWEAIAPKVYRYTSTRGKLAGKWVAKAKGIHGDAAAHWPKLAAGERVSIDSGVKSFLVAARDGGPLFQAQHTTRQLGEMTEWCGARLRDGDRTRAPSVKELAKLP